MEEKKKKLSYEELESLTKQLTEQNDILMNQNNQVNMVTFFKRLDYLFRMLEYSKLFKEEITNKVCEEINNLLFEDNENQ